MVKAIWCALLLAGLAAQREEPPPRHDKYRDDPLAFCMPAKPPTAHGHECHCEFMCSPRADGEPGGYELENPACELYCTKERCACHAEQTCDDAPKGR